MGTFNTEWNSQKAIIMFCWQSALYCKMVKVDRLDLFATPCNISDRLISGCNLCFTGIIILVMVVYVDTLIIIPSKLSTHCEKFKILLPFGCILVAAIVWMFHEKTSETRELAVFVAAVILPLFTIFHVIFLRVVSKMAVILPLFTIFHVIFLRVHTSQK